MPLVLIDSCVGTTKAPNSICKSLWHGYRFSSILLLRAIVPITGFSLPPRYWIGIGMYRSGSAVSDHISPSQRQQYNFHIYNICRGNLWNFTVHPGQTKGEPAASRGPLNWVLHSQTLLEEKIVRVAKFAILEPLQCKTLGK